ncbi:MAG: hypothetical protein ACR2PT_16180 [Endozoicomonas sp.]
MKALYAEFYNPWFIAVVRGRTATALRYKGSAVKAPTSRQA